MANVAVRDHKNQAALPLEQGISWWRKISVEPTMFLYMLAFMITSVVEQVFYLYKACRVNHGYDEDICRHLEKHKDIKRQVQLTVSDFHQWNNIAGHVIPIILALFLGAWSDRRGRKLPLILGLIGKFFWTVMVIVNVYQKDWPLEYIIYTATLPSGLTGADIAIFASCFAYISDISTVSDRTLRITILDAFYLSTMPTGVALGNLIFNRTDQSYATLFYINGGLLVAAIVYSIIFLSSHTTQKQKDAPRIKWYQMFGDFFDRNHVIVSLKTLLKKRPENRRIYLFLVLAGMAFYTFGRDEKPMMFLYTQLKFDWTSDTYSHWKTYQSTAYVVVMMLGIPFLNKVMKWPDTGIIMLGAICHGIARVIFVYARASYVLYIGGIFASIGPIIGPVLRSITSKLVPINERGIIFAFLSVCDNAVPLFSGVIYTQVYNHTIDSYPAAIFWVTFATQMVVLIFFFGIHLSLKGRQIDPPPGNIYTGEEDDDSIVNSTEALPIPSKDDRLRDE